MVVAPNINLLLDLINKVENTQFTPQKGLFVRFFCTENFSIRISLQNKSTVTLFIYSVDVTANLLYCFFTL